ncbi:MAG TPA: sulfate ABC transporter permease subunit CysT [Chloroflexota bacterium]
MSSLARTPAVALPAPRIARLGGSVLMRGVVMGYLSVIVLLPLAAVVWKSTGGGWSAFWQVVSSPDTVAAIRLTILASLLVVIINAVAGTIIAWVLVRDSFPGQMLLNAVIDLPFALPTVVAGITLLALYGPQSPLKIDAAYTRAGVVLALLFVTLPFVVRAVQPVLMELDQEMEEAAASLGASPRTTFRRIVLPNLLPAILSGVGLGFARAMGEYGSVVIISGNIPFQTEVASVHIYGQIETDNVPGAAAISVVLLAVSLLVLLTITVLERWGAAHGR